MTLPPHYYKDLAHLNQWCIKLTNGQLHINRRFCPPLLPGEKYAHRIVFVSASTEDLQMPMFSWHTDIGISSRAYPEPNEGGLYVTDQRVILWRGPRFGSYGEWNWNQFEEAHLLRPTLGIALVPPNSDDHALILANKWRHGITPPAARKVLLNWLKIEATFHYSHGTLDDWMTQLPERLAAYYTNFTPPLITSMEPQTADYTDPLHPDAHLHADQYASPLEPVATVHEWKPPTSAQKHEALNQVRRWTFSALAVFFACCSPKRSFSASGGLPRRARTQVDWV